MIVRCSYEELAALRSGVRVCLGSEVGAPVPAVMAPPESRADVEALAPRLEGDLSVTTLAEVRAVDGAVTTIVECLRAEMEAAVVMTHPAGETAVSAYFDFAHALSVLHRLAEVSAEMTAMIELVTGQPPTESAARTFDFPD